MDIKGNISYRSDIAFFAECLVRRCPVVSCHESRRIFPKNLPHAPTLYLCSVLHEICCHQYVCNEHPNPIGQRMQWPILKNRAQSQLDHARFNYFEQRRFTSRKQSHPGCQQSTCQQLLLLSCHPRQQEGTLQQFVRCQSRFSA